MAVESGCFQVVGSTPTLASTVGGFDSRQAANGGSMAEWGGGAQAAEVVVQPESQHT